MSGAYCLSIHLVNRSYLQNFIKEYIVTPSKKLKKIVIDVLTQHTHEKMDRIR